MKNYDISVASEFVLPSLAPPVETFVNLVKRDINLLKIQHEGLPPKHSNLTHREEITLQTLTDNPSLTIKLADKGGGIVVMDTLKYVEEANRQLSDTLVYQWGSRCGF